MDNSELPILLNYSEPTIRSLITFELVSIWGRYIFKSKSKIKPIKEPFLIDLGAGTNYTEGWTHVNFYKNPLSSFWKTKNQIIKTDIETDLRYPLNCPDNIVDGVYSSHTLEHLFPDKAKRLLSEILRILKPGCWLRIIVPDISKIIDYYNGTNRIFDYKYKAEALGHYTQDWGHHSLYDEELMVAILKLTGFVNVKKVIFGEEGTDKRLIKEEEVRKIDSLVIEAQKP